MQNNKEARQDSDVLRKDITRLQSDLNSLLSHMPGNSHDRASVLRRKLKTVGQRGRSYTEDTIRESPLVSVMALFFVGVIMGWLLDRKIGR